MCSYLLAVVKTLTPGSVASPYSQEVPPTDITVARPYVTLAKLSRLATQTTATVCLSYLFL